jgi:hypothetical protein
MITRDEWLSALNEAGYHDEKHDPDAVTAPEFAALFGISRRAAECRLKRLVEIGQATRTFKRTTRMDGKPLTLPAYRLVKSEQPKRKRKAA